MTGLELDDSQRDRGFSIAHFAGLESGLLDFPFEVVNGKKWKYLL